MKLGMIDNLTDEQKSVILAKAMGNPNWTRGVWANPAWATQVVEQQDFYDPANMALAWRVLNWAHAIPAYTDWMIQPNPLGIWFNLTRMAPADAQRFWLDKILEFANEAGLIEANNG